MKEQLAKDIRQGVLYHCGVNSDYGGEWLIGKEDYDVNMDESGIIDVGVDIDADSGEPTRTRKFEFSVIVKEII